MRETSPGSGIRGTLGMVIAATGGSLCTSFATNISHLYPVNVTPQAGGIRLVQSGDGTLSLDRGSQPVGTSAAAVLAANNPAPLGSVMVTETVGQISVTENSICLLPPASGGGEQ